MKELTTKLYAPVGLIMMLLVCVAGIASGQSRTDMLYVQNETLDQHKKPAVVPLSKVLEEIERTHHIRFLYQSDLIEGKTVRKAMLTSANLARKLGKLLVNNGLTYNKQGNSTYIIKRLAGFQTMRRPAAAAQITGTVTDGSTGETLPGVNILVKGTSTGTSTDNEGNFELTVESLQDTLVVSFIGYQTQEVPIEGRTEISIEMQSQAITGEEMVVVGYGEQKEENVTGAVSSISSEELETREVNTMGDVLQGQMPGLNVSIADGKPGRSAGFNIRGVTSINGAEPLVVIDGVPQSTSDLNNLSPGDIEELSVLKDAASTAIYGARASSGVILITTKKGRSDGGTSIKFTTQQTYSTPLIVPDIYDNPTDYLEIKENEFNANIGQSYWTDAQIEYPHLVADDPSLPQAQVKNIGGNQTLLTGGKVYNYYKKWFNKYRPSRNYKLSINGGNQKLQYFLSGNYNYEQGAIKFKPAKINRYGLRSNINYEINNHISLFNNTSLIKRREERPNQYLYGFTSNIFRFIENSWAMMPEYVNIDGEEVPTDLGFYKEFLENQSGDNRDIYDVKSTLGLDISLLKNKLNINIDGTYQYDYSERHRWWDNSGPYLSNSFNNRNIVLDKYSDAGPPTAYKGKGNTITSNINAYATYQNSFGNHDTKLTAGFNQETSNYRYDYAGALNPLSGQNSLSLATGDMNVSDDDSKYKSRSYFVRLNYNWQERYLIELNGSYFLSSKFPEGKKGDIFPSMSVGWRLTEEPFFDLLKDKFQNLKLRVSYGSTGNANVSPYEYLSSINISQSYFTLDGERVSIASAPEPKSPNFTWETVTTLDFGLDFALLENRLKGSFDIYNRHTDDMLAKSQSLPSVFGAQVPQANIASLSTRGFEISLDWSDDFKLFSDNFRYGIGVNFSDYHSKITSFYNPTDYLGDYYEGQKLGEIWGLKTLGYFKTDEAAQNGPHLDTNSYNSYAAAGTIKFKDVNNDGVISWEDRTLNNPGDYSVIGNSTPRYQFGITLNGQWNKFDINAFFKGIAKRDIYPGPESTNFWGPYNRKYQVMPRHTVENRWTPENTDAYFPRPQGYLALGGNDLGQAQTRYLQDASYVRLKNLVIGYNISNYLRIYIQGRNLWTSTNLHHSLDPEGLEKDPDANLGLVGLGTAYSPQRSYSVGIQFDL